MPRDKSKQKIAQNAHYIKNKDAYLDRTRAKRTLRKEWYDTFLSKRCCFSCGEKSIECLDLHHIDPLDKDQGVPLLLHQLRAFSRIVEEIKKCVVLCANCHRKHHAGTLGITFTQEHAITISLEDCPEEPKLLPKMVSVLGAAPSSPVSKTGSDLTPPPQS